MRRPRSSCRSIPLSDGAGEVVEVGAGVTRRQDRRPRRRHLLPALDRRPGAARHPGSGAGRHRRRHADRIRAARRRGRRARSRRISPTRRRRRLPCAGAHRLARAGRGVGGVKPGDAVLLLGTGGVSIFGLQFAHMARARAPSWCRRATRSSRKAQGDGRQRDDQLPSRCRSGRTRCARPPAGAASITCST